MVDVLVTNDKLRARALRMIADIANVDADTAAAALADAGDNTKLAILIAGGLARAEAELLLGETDGNLRQALAQQAATG